MYFKFFILIIFSFNIVISDISEGYTLFTIMPLPNGPGQTMYNTQLIDNDWDGFLMDISYDGNPFSDAISFGREDVFLQDYLKTIFPIDDVDLGA